MYIEKAGLSERHARVHYDPESGNYFLSDLDSESGTWIKVQSTLLPGEPIREGAVFKIGGIQFHVKYGEEETIMNGWIERYNLTDLEASLRHIKRKEDLKDFDLQSLTGSPSMIERLEIAVGEIQTLPDSIRPLVFESDNLRFEVKWKEVTIGSMDICDVVLPNLSACQIKILLINNTYYIVNLSSNNFEVYRKLAKDEVYKLVPGLSFRIGKLEFEACKFNVGRVSEKGIRPKMEDTDCIFHNLWLMEEIPISFYAIYDGHGGNSCSNFLKENLHKMFRLKWLENTHKRTNVPLALKESLESAYIECDDMFYRQDPETAKYVGSAAVVSMIMGDRIIVSNLGDSKAILCRKGRAIELTADHKPVIHNTGLSRGTAQD